MRTAVGFVAGMLLALPLHGQERQPYTLSVDVDLVVLNVRVLDRNGKSVHGLSKENFYLEEDGRSQKIDLFIGENSPATIGLVLDASASMNSKQAEVQAGALRFVQSSHPRDQVFILQFNEKLYRPLPQGQLFTDDAERLVQALSRTPPGGKTALYDAIHSALAQAGRGELEKRALVVMSDGGDNASRRTLQDVLRFAQESNVTIYTIGLFDPLAVGSNRSVLRKLAGLTGGDAYFPERIEQLAPVWEDIAHGIRTQYTIAYRPAQTLFDGKFHKVRVRVKAPGQPKVRIHTRSGYLARKAVPEP